MNDGENGWLAQAENPVDLARAIDTCICSPYEQRLEKSQKGRKWVEDNFHYEKMIQEFVKLCEE